MAFDQIHLKGATSRMIEVMLRDSTTGGGKTGVAFGSVTARYIREGAASGTAVTSVTATLGTFASGGWAEVDATNSPGLYQFGIPNAAIATGADAVTLTFKAAGAIDKAVRIVLIDANLRDAASLGLSRMDAPVGGVAAGTVTAIIADATLTTARINAATAATQATNAATSAATAASAASSAAGNAASAAGSAGSVDTKLSAIVMTKIGTLPTTGTVAKTSDVQITATPPDLTSINTALANIKTDTTDTLKKGATLRFTNGAAGVFADILIAEAP